MADVHPRRDSSEMEFPRQSMHVYVRTRVAASADNAVPTSLRAKPEPATIGLLDARPKAFFDRTASHYSNYSTGVESAPAGGHVR
jgi:hypothetical protein